MMTMTSIYPALGHDLESWFPINVVVEKKRRLDISFLDEGEREAFLMS